MVLAGIAVALAFPAIAAGMAIAGGLFLAFSPFPFAYEIVLPTALGSWAAASASVVAATVRLVRDRRNGRARRALLIAGPGAVLGSAAIVCAIVFVPAALGSDEPNRAAELAQPILQSYRDRGGSVVCGDEDNGYSPSNRQPWFVAYLDLPADAASPELAMAALRDAGYPNAMIRPPYEPASGEAIAETTVASSEIHPEATIAVYREGLVSHSCWGAGLDYGDDREVESERALVIIMVTLPTRPLSESG